MGDGLMLVGIGLIVFHIWLSFELWGYSFNENIKKGMQESAEDIYRNKNKNLASKAIFYCLYIYKKKILIYSGIALLIIGLAINILK